MFAKRTFRTIITGSAVAMLALTLSACGGQDAENAGSGGGPSGQLVIASLGGSYQEAQSEAFFKPYAEESGVKVTEANQDGTVGPLKAQVEAGNPQWDVIDLGPIDARQAAADGLLEPLDKTVVSGSGLFPGAMTDNYVATIYSSNVIAWNKDKLATGPQNAAEFWDTEEFPGMRALPGYSPFSTLEQALLADGVPKDKLYPLDVDRAFTRLDQIRDSTTFYNTNEQGIQLLTSGQVAAASVPNGRVFNAIKDGQPLDYTWRDGVLYIDYWAVPKGAANKEEAMKFIAFASEAEPQARLAEIIPYGGSNEAANDLIPAERQADLPTGGQNLSLQVTPDLDWWSENVADVTERWQAWLLKS
jgi:putative spermidine/putrescine transport system substrate-binding protein